MDKKDTGPLWQLEQNLKHYEATANAFGEDSRKLLIRSEEAREMAQTYRDAIEKLKN